jgi:hypothetical protein
MCGTRLRSDQVFWVFEQCCKSASFNADPDQDLTSCFDAGPDPDPDPSLKLGQVCRWFRFAQLAKGKKFRP